MQLKMLLLLDSQNGKCESDETCPVINEVSVTIDTSD